MKNLNIIFNSVIGMALSLTVSCTAAKQPNAPFSPDTNTSSRNRVPVNLNGVNLFALLLSPTQDQLELLDLVDNRVKLSVSTGRNPVELSVSPDKAHILVINQLDGTISSYFREDNQRIQSIGTIGSGFNPTDVIFNNSGTEAYVAYQGTGRIDVLQILNRARPLVKKVLTLKDTDAVLPPSPYKLAINADGTVLYAVDKNNGKVYSFRKINDQFTQENISQISSNSERAAIEDMIFYDNKLYLSDSNNAKITVFDTKVNKVTASISLSSQDIKNEILPGKLAVSSRNKKLYVANQGSSTVAVINLNTNTLVKHIFLAQNTNTDSLGPSDLSVSENGDTVYVTNSAGRNLSIISGKEDRLLRNIGTSPSSGAIAPLSAIQIL